MELIVDLMLPTQGHFSICNQVDDQYMEHSCLIVFMLLMHPFSTRFCATYIPSQSVYPPYDLVTTSYKLPLANYHIRRLSLVK